MRGWISATPQVIERRRLISEPIPYHVERFVKDEPGATVIEYGPIAALIAVGIIAAARGLGSQIGDA